MVGSSHEALHRIFQKDPAVLTKALQRVLHVPFPEPLVLGPDNVPVITDEHWGEQGPSLSAMTHGRGPQAPAVLECLAAILKTVDPDTASVYAQSVDWRHPLAEQVREEGREEGRIETSRAMLLRLLEWRHIPVPTTVRARVESCTDLDQLETWFEGALHAVKMEELFAEE